MDYRRFGLGSVAKALPLGNPPTSWGALQTMQELLVATRSGGAAPRHKNDYHIAATAAVPPAIATKPYSSSAHSSASVHSNACAGGLHLGEEVHGARLHLPASWGLSLWGEVHEPRLHLSTPRGASRRQRVRVEPARRCPEQAARRCQESTSNSPGQDRYVRRVRPPEGVSAGHHERSRADDVPRQR